MKDLYETFFFLLEVFLKDVAKNTTNSHCSGERWSSGTLKRERRGRRGIEAEPGNRGRHQRGRQTDTVPAASLRGDTKRNPTPVNLNSFCSDAMGSVFFFATRLDAVQVKWQRGCTLWRLTPTSPPRSSRCSSSP